MRTMRRVLLLTNELNPSIDEPLPGRAYMGCDLVERPNCLLQVRVFKLRSLSRDTTSPLLGSELLSDQSSVFWDG